MSKILLASLSPLLFDSHLFSLDFIVSIPSFAHPILPQDKPPQWQTKFNYAHFQTVIQKATLQTNAHPPHVMAIIITITINPFPVTSGLQISLKGMSVYRNALLGF